MKTSWRKRLRNGPKSPFEIKDQLAASMDLNFTPAYGACSLSLFIFNQTIHHKHKTNPFVSNLLSYIFNNDF